MKTIHHPSLSLFLAVIKGQSRILLHTQHFADSPTVTMLFFFHFENKIKALSTIYQPNLSFFKPSSKASRVSFCTHNISRPHLQLQIFFFTSRTKSKLYQQFIHWASPFLNHHQKPVAFLLHTQLFAASPTVTNFFFSLQELNQNFINNLSTEPLLF